MLIDVGGPRPLWAASFLRLGWIRKLTEHGPTGVNQLTDSILHGSCFELLLRCPSIMNLKV